MSLLAPWFLLGLGALALPWMLHRFSRTVPPERPFPSTRFLEATTPPVSRRKRLRYRGLLAMRWLLLLLASLLFAQPVWQRWLDDGGAAGVRFIALDASFSMRHGERVARARAAASDAIDESLAAGEAVRLFAAGAGMRPLGPLTRDPAAARAALDGYRVGFARLDYGQAMQRLDALAGDVEGPVRLTLVTDAQASAMPTRLAALQAPRAIAFEVLDVATDADRNHALRAEGTLRRDGTSASVRVAIETSTARDGSASGPREVLVTHDGDILARRVIDGAERIVFDAIPLPDRTIDTLTVAFAEPDALPEDDLVTVVLRSAEPEPVWLLQTRAGAAQDAAVFVATALESGGFRVEQGRASDTPPASVAIVFDVDELPPAVARFVANGGSALLIPATVDRDSEINDDTPAIGEGEPVGVIDAAHALPLAEMRWNALRWYALADMPVGEDDRVLVATKSGRPVLVEIGTAGDVPGTGRLLRLGDPLDGYASDLPLHPDFVILLRSIVDWFLGSQALPERLDAGARVRLPATVEVRAPDGGVMRSLVERASATEIHFDEPGVYAVSTPQGAERLTVRIPPAESRLDRLDATAVAAWQDRHAMREPNDDRLAGNEATRRLPASIDLATTTFWPWLFVALLAVALAELVFANRRLDVRRDA